ncbi:helix-turn-helix domain-containing protein [Haloplanus sp. GCM10025708]|uniref:helix-turn-helix domain-containing protein n=1 Tax=Haloferacaceae TaxID=1644056 RepID=UPI00360E331C
MPNAKLNVTLPEGVWIRDLSSEFPDATFRVLAALPDEETGVGLVEIRSDDLRNVIETMDELEGVSAIDPLRVVEDEALVQFETDEPLLLLSIRDSRIPFEPPVTISDGAAAVEITASRERLSELGEQLRAFGMPFEVEYIRQSIDSRDLLTERQRDLLRTAVENGYYDTPRRCTLTELAENVGIAKSTASEQLHRAEETVVKEFVSDAFGDSFDDQ